MTKTRITYIDMAKGIGILLVLIGHSEFPSAGLITWISSFHMPLFFILSGMLFSHNNTCKKDGKTFFCKKATSILLPYGIFSILSIIASAILDADLFPEYLWEALIQTVSFRGIAVLWFLPVLFFAESGFFFISKKLSEKNRIYTTLLIFAFSILLNEWYHRYCPVADNYAALFVRYLLENFIHVGIAMTFLAIGYYLHAPFTAQKLTQGQYLILGAGFFVLNQILGFKNGGVDLNQLVFHNYILYYLAALSGSMFVICLCNFLPDFMPLRYLGKNSLILMATHMNCRFFGASFLVADFFLKLLPQAGITGYYFVVAICMTILELIAITVINRYFPFLIGKRKNFQVIS